MSVSEVRLALQAALLAVAMVKERNRKAAEARKNHVDQGLRAPNRPLCSECGVAIDEHPYTDACALAQEARGGVIDPIHLAAIDPPAFVLCGRPAMTWTEKPGLSPVRAWTLNPEKATCINCLHQQAERDAGRVHAPVRIARKVAP